MLWLIPVVLVGGVVAVVAMSGDDKGGGGTFPRSGPGRGYGWSSSQLPGIDVLRKDGGACIEAKGKDAAAFMQWAMNNQSAVIELNQMSASNPRGAVQKLFSMMGCPGANADTFVFHGFDGVRRVGGDVINMMGKEGAGQADFLGSLLG